MCFLVWKVLLMSVSPVLVKDSWTISSPSPWISPSVAVATLSLPHCWVVWWYQLQILSKPTSCHRIIACESWKGLRDVILRRENWSSKKEQWLVWSKPGPEHFWVLLSLFVIFSFFLSIKKKYTHTHKYICISIECYLGIRAWGQAKSYKVRTQILPRVTQKVLGVQINTCRRIERSRNCP